MSSHASENSTVYNHSCFTDPLHLVKNQFEKYHNRLDEDIEIFFKGFDRYKQQSHELTPTISYFPIKLAKIVSSNNSKRRERYHFSDSKHLDPGGTFVPKQVDSIRNGSYHVSQERVSGGLVFPFEKKNEEYMSLVKPNQFAKMENLCYASAIFLFIL